MTSVVRYSSVTPTEFALHQNYPNPFNPSTQIRFSVAEAGLVKLSVFNLLGKEVGVIVNQTLVARNYLYQFSTTEFPLPSGIYFYKLEAKGRTLVRKMMLLK